MTELTPEQVLDLPMQGNEAGAATIREYLIALVRGVWREREGFSGKRPFGDSGWHRELYVALGAAGAVNATVTADGFVVNVDGHAADTLIAAAIDELAQPGPCDTSRLLTAATRAEEEAAEMLRAAEDAQTRAARFRRMAEAEETGRG